jgi:hypothetical protein
MPNLTHKNFRLGFAPVAVILCLSYFQDGFGLALGIAVSIMSGFALARIQDEYHPTTITVMDLKDYAPLPSSHQAKESGGEWGRTKASLYLCYLFFGLCAIALIYRLVSWMRMM